MSHGGGVKHSASPSPLTRLRARLISHCLFIDQVVHREVRLYRTLDGREYMGFNRWSDWVQRTEPE